MGKWVYEDLKLLFMNIIEVLLPRPRFCNGCGRQLKGSSEYQLCSICQSYLHRYIYLDEHHINVTPNANAVDVDVHVPDNIVNDLFVACNYDDLAKELVYKIKYKDKRECAITLALYMAKALERDGSGKEIFDCIVPVPISLRKLRKRGYNHVSLIAEELSKLLGLPVQECLIRTKDTKPQVLFNEQERWYNVKDCFICNSKLENLHVLLIDDLITTGATVFYCATELKRAGAANVTTLAFARSVRF